MRFVLWLMFVASVLVNVYVNTFTSLTGAGQVVASVCTGAAVLGSAVGLWLTRSRREA
ncbi:MULTISPECIES: hypothetical protein [unclassified Streptomyces]|uniref:hypothetical protein n=1 Tax=unclassified Streptomyces TaxID=2593676 RepID=UPI0018FE5DDC|nr:MULTISPECIES: hypothetical protein [unclassified Streptomyces]